MNQVKSIEIEGRKIGAGHAPYIVAELSANHNGRLERALETITMAKQMGADAIKLQTYTADSLTIDCDGQEFQIEGGLWDGYSLYELYDQAHTPYEWHAALFAHARKIGITCFSTPFDEGAVDLLESLNAPAYKVASFEAIDLPLIDYVAHTGKPMIISTGMANKQEIADAVDTARNGGCHDLILLHCISGYPTPVDQSNLLTIPDISKHFGVLAGLSDHSLGTAVSIAGVTLGACVIEKHVTLNRRDAGPDSAFSLEPQELQKLCNDCRNAWRALGKAGYELQPVEDSNLKFRRSIYVVADIDAGGILTEQNIRRIRPGYGLAPRYYNEIMGKTVNVHLKRGTALTWDVINR